MCDGPPYMNRKMHALAFGSKCGFFGASGLTKAVFVAALACPGKNPSADSSPARAAEVNPAPVSHRNSRRVRPQNWLALVSRIALASDGFVVRLPPARDRFQLLEE